MSKVKNFYYVDKQTTTIDSPIGSPIDSPTDVDVKTLSFARCRFLPNNSPVVGGGRFYTQCPNGINGNCSDAGGCFDAITGEFGSPQKNCVRSECFVEQNSPFGVGDVYRYCDNGFVKYCVVTEKGLNDRCTVTNIKC